MTGTNLRRGTTVVVVAGPEVGIVGKVTGYDRGYNIETPFGGGWRLVRAKAHEVVRAPHPFGWYNRVQSGTHSCLGCDEVQAAMTAARQEVTR